MRVFSQNKTKQNKKQNKKQKQKTDKTKRGAPLLGLAKSIYYLNIIKIGVSKYKTLYGIWNRTF